MSSSAADHSPHRNQPRTPLATGARVTDDALVVDLDDGRTLSVPLAWYPRLLHGTPAERAEGRVIGRGDGIHWPALDEDISVAGLPTGRASPESPRSLERWLAGRARQGAA